LWILLRIADPRHPVEVGHYDTPGAAVGVAVLDSLAYVADFDSGFWVVSVVDSAHPLQVGHCDTRGLAWDVAVIDSFAYLAGRDSGGLEVISVADPAQPVEVGRCDTPGDAWGVAVSGDYAYVADGDSGLRVISVVNPTQPIELGYYNCMLARGVVVSGDYAYVAGHVAGLLICQFHGGAVEEAPNVKVRTAILMPMVVRGVLHLQADSRQQTVDRAELLDAAGRKVAELHAGANDVSRLAPGVYFVREEPQAASSKPQAVRKVVLTE